MQREAHPRLGVASPIGAALLVLFSIGFATLTSAREPHYHLPPKNDGEVPIYRSEKAAVKKLKRRLTRRANVYGASLDRLRPQAPQKWGGSAHVGFEVAVSGPFQQAVNFVCNLYGKGKFITIPKFAIHADPRDPEFVRAEFVIKDWYRLKVKQRSTDIPQKLADFAIPNLPATELFVACTNSLPEKGSWFTDFAFENDTVSIFGKSKTPQDVRDFETALSENKTIAAYQWTWENEPAADAKEKEGTIVFEIVGRLHPTQEGK